MLRQGHIIRYPYLWRWQAERGETEGRKVRPVCVALPVSKNGQTHLFLLPLTTTAPKGGQASLPVPETEMRRAGLDGLRPCWVLLDECNYDLLERSFYLDPSQVPSGRFSETFTSQIKTALKDLLISGRMRQVHRR